MFPFLVSQKYKKEKKHRNLIISTFIFINKSSTSFVLQI